MTRHCTFIDVGDGTSVRVQHVGEMTSELQAAVLETFHQVNSLTQAEVRAIVKRTYAAKPEEKGSR